MDCKRVEETISMYIENELPEDQYNAISRHMEQCDTCRILKNQVEELLYAFPDLEEEVPFYLRNRLYYIPESQEVEDQNESSLYFLKWVAAAIGTFVLFLNLFFFTNLYPPANRVLHTAVSKVKTFTVKAGAFFERAKESKDLMVSTLLKDKDRDDEEDDIEIDVDSEFGVQDENEEDKTVQGKNDEQKNHKQKNDDSTNIKDPKKEESTKKENAKENGGQND